MWSSGLLSVDNLNTPAQYLHNFHCYSYHHCENYYLFAILSEVVGLDVGGLFFNVWALDDGDHFLDVGVYWTLGVLDFGVLDVGGSDLDVRSPFRMLGV